MKNGKLNNSHYLSISCKAIVKNRIIHYILFFGELYYLFFFILDLYSKDFKINQESKITSPFLFLIIMLNQLAMEIRFIIFFVIMLFIIVSYFILNFRRVKINIIVKVFVNANELIFHRLLSLLMFNYLHILKGIYLFISIVITAFYAFILLFNFYENHLCFFFPNLVNYPYDQFSMIIDIHVLIIKIFISISTMSSNRYTSILFFILSLFILIILLLYLTFLLRYKSYYIMNNCSLNKMKYSIILSVCITIIFILIIDKRDITNIYYIFIYTNIFLLCIFICSFYDPYKYCKFDKDDNEENVIYYFFILNRNKNHFLLIEEKIQIHLSRCQRCNLCKKYNSIKEVENKEIDLYYVISDGKNIVFNLMNNLLREIKRNGRTNFENNTYYLINIIYIYCIFTNRNDNNSKLNTELLFDIINFENSNILEEYNVCLNQIKYTNNFLNKAKKLLEYFEDILNEKKFCKITHKIFDFGEKLKELKYKEIKSSMNNLNYNSSNNAYGLPSCSNLMTICSIFYEELFNEPFANSGIYIREGANLLEDLINNNNKNSKQITLEINIQNLKIKIIRAGGYFNKYENYDLCDFFPNIFKNRQLIEIKNILLNSNDSFQMEKLKEKYKNKKGKKVKQYIKFNFIIEEKEDNYMFCKILKLKLTLILLTNINLIIYLNGTYNLDNNIIVSEQKKDEEQILYFGCKEQIELVKKNKNDTIIKTYHNKKYLGNNKLIKECKCFTDCKKYNVYHCIQTYSKKSFIERLSQNKLNITENIFEDEKTNMHEESKKLFLFNDIASQASSTTSSISRNNIISYNRGNKLSQNENKMPKEFNIFQFILFFSLFIFFAFLIFQALYNTKYQKNLYKKNDFYLSLREYRVNSEKLFFSILSIVCLANNYNTSNCTHYMKELIRIAEEKYSGKEIYGINSSMLSFIDFTELIFYQNHFLYEDLNIKLSSIIKYLSLFNNENIIKRLKGNVSHYKINQNFENDTLELSLSEENISFSDFLLLITSRFGMIIKNYEDLYNPIYILNKTGVEIFNNIYNKKMLNSYQLNIYLMILDYKSYSGNFDLIITEIEALIINLRNKFKRLMYTFIFLNLCFVMIILLILTIYVGLYFFIIFNILKIINNKLEEKLGENSIKEILRRKIYNLKLLLSFYENNLNAPMNDLNIIYSDYKENLNTKVKEEMKVNKKEVKNQIENNNKNCIQIFKIIGKYDLLKNSGRKNIYLKSLIFIIIISLALFIIILLNWIIFFKRHQTLLDWVALSEDINSSTNKLMNNLLIMIYDNQTLDDISQSIPTEDYISYIFVKLGQLYDAGGIFMKLNFLTPAYTNDLINFNCWLFYKDLQDDLFEKIKNKYINEQDKLFITLYIFCQWSKAMEFKNYKSIYLQLYNNIEVIMENFDNLTYQNIALFFYENSIIKVEIIYLITYVYLVEMMNKNIKFFTQEMLNILGNYVISTIIGFFLLLVLLIIIIYAIYIRNVDNDCKKFIQIRKVFKVCNLNE